jgi:hypothetical protein
MPKHKGAQKKEITEECKINNPVQSESLRIRVGTGHNEVATSCI